MANQGGKKKNQNHFPTRLKGKKKTQYMHTNILFTQYIYMYVCTIYTIYVYMYVCMYYLHYIYMYVCMYIYIYIAEKL